MASHNFRGSHDQIQIEIKIQSLDSLGCPNDQQTQASLAICTFIIEDLNATRHQARPHSCDAADNSLDAQYDAASAYIKSQAHAGWALIRSRYDDGGYSGDRLTGPTYSDCWTTSAPGRLMSSSSTRSTV